MDIAFLFVVVVFALSDTWRTLASLACMFSGTLTTCAQALNTISVILIKEYNLEPKKGALQPNRTVIITLGTRLLWSLLDDRSRWGTPEFKWQGWRKEFFWVWIFNFGKFWQVFVLVALFKKVFLGVLKTNVSIFVLFEIFNTAEAFEISHLLLVNSCR